MDGRNFEALKAHILPLSISNDFEVARTEWDLVGVEISEQLDNCPCGTEIKEHCYIANRLTGEHTYVGNVCIRRFMGIETGNLFEGLRRLAKDPTSNPNIDVIEYAFKKGYLFGVREYEFLKSIARKRKLSPRQQSWKEDIVQRILNQTVVARRTSK